LLTGIETDLYLHNFLQDEVAEQLTMVPQVSEGSYNIGPLPIVDTHWRDREIKSIVTGADERSKKILRRFAPFDDIVAASLGMSVPGTDIPRINWRAFFRDGQHLAEPSIVGADISAASWRCFQQVPFYSWARFALGFEDEAVLSFKLCHEGLKLHVCHYLRRHVAQSPWVMLLAEVRQNISMHNPSCGC
jgi:hypothetical protein